MKRHPLFLIVIGMALVFLAARADEHEDTTIIKAGDKAPHFTCETIDGETFAMREHAGKVVFINFFATWCGPCLDELPHLKKDIYEVFKEDADFRLIVIGREHTADELKAFREKKALDLPFAPDPDRGIYSLYASKYIPRNIIVGRDGVVEFAQAGFNPEMLAEMTTLVKKELALKPVAPGPVPVAPMKKSK